MTGGAIDFEPSGATASSMSITNSTFTGNSTTATGSGIESAGGAIAFDPFFQDAPVTLLNDTITGNTTSGDPAVSGDGGGGLDIDADAPGTHVTATNTIISGNKAKGGAVANDCDASLHSDHSLEFQSSSCGLDMSGSPMLGSLADNGGPTKTIALMSGSAAIDVGDPAQCPPTDQRGFGRPDDASSACDIGAFELGAKPPSSSAPSSPPPPFVPPGSVILPGTPAQPGVGGLTFTVTFHFNPDGSVTVIISVPGPGQVTAQDANGQTLRAAAARRHRRKRRSRPRIRRATATATHAGPVQLTLRLTAAGRKVLRQRGKVPVTVLVTFKPISGTPTTKTFAVTFKKPARRHR